MGNSSAIARKEELGSIVVVYSDFVYHRNHMETYGCGEEYRTAIWQCNPDYPDQAGRERDDDACAKATAALRRCMEADPVHFRAYIQAMDEGLDEDARKAVAGEPPLWPADDDDRFRWWTGMKRT